MHCLCLLLVYCTAIGQEPVFTVRFEKGPLSKAIVKLRQETGAMIAFREDDVAAISVGISTYTGKTAGSILQDLLRPHPLQIKMEGSVYVIVKKPVVKAAASRTGSITGKVVDFETADPLPGATVQVPAQKKGVTTDDKGIFMLDRLEDGEYEVVISYAGYQAARIDHVKVTSGKTARMDVKLQPDRRQLGTFEVKSGRRLFGKINNTTDAQLLSEIRSNRSLSSGVSNEQIVRSTDRDAGEVARRITGVSVVDNRQLVVRGLNQRYNITFLNDVIAPSTEQDSRAFSLDLIPSNLIDKMLVYKSPAPDLPGDFAGGVLRITTKNTMPVRQVDVQLSAQYRPNTSFNDFDTYRGGKYDLLGFDDGTRKIPAGFPDAVTMSLMPATGRTTYARMLPNIWQPVSGYHGLDVRGVINYYDTWKTGKHTQLGNLTSITYTRTGERNIIERQRGNTLEQQLQDGSGKPYTRRMGSISYDDEDRSVASVRIGVQQNFSFLLRDSSSLTFKNFFNQLGADQVSTQVGAVAENAEAENKRTNLFYRQRTLYSGQFAGSHLLSRRSPLRWGIGYAYTSQQEPDNRMLLFTRLFDADVRPFDENPEHSWQMSLSDGGQFFDYNLRTYTKTIEHGYTGYIDYEYHLPQSPVVLKFGTYNEFKDRDFSTREIQVIYGPMVGSGLDTRIDRFASPEEIYHSSNFREDGSGFEIQERFNSYYRASNQLNAFYAAAELPLKDKLRIYAGARLEYYHFRMAAAGKAGYGMVYPIAVDNPKTWLLPSVNITYNIHPDHILRAAYGKSLNRPEFRELAPFAYYNNITGIYEYGNPELKTASFDNGDLRWEYYLPGRLKNEMISLGVFYKYARDPIEAFTLNDKNSQGGNQLLYKNSEHAHFYGAEAEVRKNLDFIGGTFFKRLSVILNASCIGTEVFTPGREDGPFSLGNSDKSSRIRPLQGQSKWLLNGSLNYENISSGSKVSMSYTYRSDRIAIVGNSDLAGDGKLTEGRDDESGFADIMEKGRSVLDLAFFQRVTRWLQIKVSAQDLLNEPVRFYEDWNRNYRYNPEIMMEDSPGFKTGKGDNNFMRFRPNTYYSLSFNFVLN